MKKVLPIALIAVFGVMTLTSTSCKKKSTTSSCTCKYKSPWTNNDTTWSVSGVPAGSSTTSLSAYCTSADSLYKAVYGSSYGCHM